VLFVFQEFTRNELNHVLFNNLHLVGGIPTPLKNDGLRQLGWWHSQLNGVIKNIPNHQPGNKLLFWLNKGIKNIPNHQPVKHCWLNPPDDSFQILLAPGSSGSGIALGTLEPTLDDTGRMAARSNGFWTGMGWWGQQPRWGRILSSYRWAGISGLWNAYVYEGLWQTLEGALFCTPLFCRVTCNLFHVKEAYFGGSKNSE